MKQAELIDGFQSDNQSIILRKFTMGITQAQLAKLAGVSRGTVDRVLNHRGHVDPLVEKKIRELAKENNYQPNKIGVQLVRMKRPLKIGYIVQSFETPFVRMMTREVESTRPLAKAQGAEIRLMTNIGSSIENQIQSLNALMDEGVDGIAEIGRASCRERV